jgi:hypothetical protein
VGVNASSEIEDSILRSLYLGLESDEWHVGLAERLRCGTGGVKLECNKRRYRRLPPASCVPVGSTWFSHVE